MKIYGNLRKSMKNLWKYMKTYQNYENLCISQSTTQAPFNKIFLSERRRDGAAFFTWAILSLSLLRRERRKPDFRAKIPVWTPPHATVLEP